MSAFNQNDPYHLGIVERAAFVSWFNLTPIMPNVERALREACIGITDYPAMQGLAQDVINRAASGVL